MGTEITTLTIPQTNFLERYSSEIRSGGLRGSQEPRAPQGAFERALASYRLTPRDIRQWEDSDPVFAAELRAVETRDLTRYLVDSLLPIVWRGAQPDSGKGEASNAVQAARTIADLRHLVESRKDGVIINNNNLVVSYNQLVELATRHEARQLTEGKHGG